MNTPRIKRNAARCLACLQVVESKHQHDFRTCECGALSVDGGKAYIRRAWSGKAGYEDMIEYEDSEHVDATPNRSNVVRVTPPHFSKITLPD